MSSEVIIPALGESIATGILSSWKVSDGSYVEIDQPIYELETDKITQEGLAEVSGVIAFLAQEGDEVEIGATIAKIEETAEKTVHAPSGTNPTIDAKPVEEISTSTPVEDISPEKPTTESILSTPSPSSSKSPEKQSPAVRKLLEETGINPSAISGSGKDGRITKGDVMEVAKSKPAEVTPEPTSPPIFPTTPSHTEHNTRSTRRPLTPIRKRIAARLVEAQQTAAILSTFNEVDLSSVISLRKIHQDSFIKRHGVKLGFMSFFVKAVVHALKAVPSLNVRIEGDEIVENHYYDISVAVGTKKGLVVPVLRNCDDLSFAEIEQSISAYAEKARTGTITLEDMQGGCFTITNGGIYGSMLSTPILNPPQSGILGMHAIQERAVVDKGEIVIRPMMYLALSYDHRVVDGKEAVTFLLKIKEAIEEPARLAIGI